MRFLLIGLVAAAFSACGASAQQVCQPGDQIDCTCPDGEASSRICLEEGLGYSACIGCKKDGGVVVPPLDEDMLHVIMPDPDGGFDLLGVEPKSTMPCSAATCNGCCDGNTCVDGTSQTSAKCHVPPVSACQACPTGYSCVANVACAKDTPQCDAASCPDGCCDGSGVCLHQSAGTCGKNGSACASCAAGTLCTDGACANDLDPNQLFKITVNSVEVLPTDSSGSDWDYLSAPDPLVCFLDTFGTQGCTEEIDDPPLPSPPLSPQRYVCNFDATTGSVDRGTNSANNDSKGTTLAFYGSELAQGLPFRVFDMDLNYSTNTIAAGKMFQITKLQTQYGILPFQQVYSLTFKISVY